MVSGCAWARTSWASVKVAGTRVIHVRLVAASFCRFLALVRLSLRVDAI